jgi:hypothetical protein
MIGSVAKNQCGRLGVICGICSLSSDTKKLKYTGIDFHGKNWECVYPEIIANTLDDYIKSIKKDYSCDESSLHCPNP